MALLNNEVEATVEEIFKPIIEAIKGYCYYGLNKDLETIKVLKAKTSAAIRANKNSFEYTASIALSEYEDFIKEEQPLWIRITDSYINEAITPIINICYGYESVTIDFESKFLEYLNEYNVTISEKGKQFASKIVEEAKLSVNETPSIFSLIRENTDGVDFLTLMHDNSTLVDVYIGVTDKALYLYTSGLTNFDGIEEYYIYDNSLETFKVV